MHQAELTTIDPAVATRIPELDLLPDAQQIDSFRAAGVGVARAMFSTTEMKEIAQAFMDATADGPVPGVSEHRKDADPGSTDPLIRYPRMLHPHRADSGFGRLALRCFLDARIWNTLRAITGEEPIGAQSMFYFKPPGARGQGLHQDNNPLAVRPGTCIAAWIALDPCDESNGALQVVPGSGPLELLCDIDHENRSDLFFNSGSIVLPEGVKPVTAEMGPGDVLFFNGQVIHGSYPNSSSDRWRRSLIFHFASESCEEIAAFYHPLLASDGTEVTRRVSPEGGICGEFHKRSMS